MKILPFALIALFALPSTACVGEGHTPDCGTAEDREGYEEEGCMTPLGGSCLTHDEFVEDRPDDPDADPPQVPEKDWIEYKTSRPDCDFDDD